LAITRAGNGLTHTRRYVHDAHHRLCKTIEPEAGATVQAYDAAGNVAWRAAGLQLPNPAQCDQAAAGIDARKVHHTYDSRDRLETVTPADGSQATRRTYTRDSLLESIETSGGARPTLRWRYSYNNRRLPVDEIHSWGDPGASWNFRTDWEAHGHLLRQHDPLGSMDLTPNALGQPRAVGTFATGVSYHPNGQIASYTAGNGVQFRSEQNLRGLPTLWQHAGVVQDRYAYDAHGNVTAITDEIGGSSRSMPWYDGLDRLRQANGPWGAGSFSYDALDNITSSTVGSRQLVHRHDAANRLEHLGGSMDVPIFYDANGNISRRGSATFEFDLANRLRVATGRAHYAYDGHGRRSRVVYANGDWSHHAYTQDGKLRLSWRQPAGVATRHVYLGDRLVAEVASGSSVSYLHTDALGSPVARTSQTRSVISRTRYEPYGATVAGSAPPQGIGFTGHVNDPDTGLVYMQQRYYDPIAGRFLSVDPVTTDAKTGDFFGRYHYANNNPYKFVDPDGRLPVVPAAVAVFATITKALIKYGSGIAKNERKGKAGEAMTRAERVDKIAGEQVSFRTSDGTRTRTDFVEKDKTVVETKTGDSTLSKGQEKLKADIKAGNEVTPVGKNAEAAGLKPGEPVKMKDFVEDRK
jgi:RHS repeat-associated protein